MEKSRSNRIFKVIVFALCILVAFIMVVPFFWMIVAAFKNNAEIFAKPIKWLPEIWRMDNFHTVFTEINFLVYFMNTFKLAIIITVIQVVTCSMSAFALSKLKFPGRDKLFLGYIATMMVPWHAIMIPQFIIIKNLGLYNTHMSLVLLWSFSAFGIFLLRQNMLSIPNSLSEAAVIDGCGYFRIYWNIIIPLTKGGIATLIIMTVTRVWNDYMGPMIYLESDMLKTIQLGLASFKQQYTANYGAIMAGTVCSVVPVIIIYAFTQKYIIEGVAFTGVKE